LNQLVSFAASSLRWLLLGENLVGLLDTSGEEVEVSHHVADILDLEIDQHTSDLWSTLWAHHGVNILVENSSGIVAVEWVLWHNGWQDLLAVHNVALVNGGWLNLLLRDDVLLNLLHSHHVALHVTHVHHSLWLASHVATLSAWTLVLTIWWAVALILIFALTLVVSSHLAVLWVSAWLLNSLHHWSLSATLALDNGWESFKKHLEIVLDVLMVSESGPVGTLVVLSTESLEVVSILCSFVVDLT